MTTTAREPGVTVTVLTSSAEPQQMGESFHEHAAAVAVVVLAARFGGLLQLRAGPGCRPTTREVA